MMLICDGVGDLASDGADLVSYDNDLVKDGADVVDDGAACWSGFCF